MNRTIYLWFLRVFNIAISKDEATRIGLVWANNVHGDFVHLTGGCRSFWKDENGRRYRVNELGK